MKEIKITAQTEGERKTAEVLIYDVIGSDFGGVGAEAMIHQLEALGPLDEITVRINSPGGDVFEGNAIYNALVRNPAHVIVEIDSLAASAASYIAMAGDEIRIAENSMVMIHQGMCLSIGNKDAMEKSREILSKIDNNIAGIYSKRTNRRVDTWLGMMAEETWFTAEEAVANRLADSITPNKKMTAANFSNFLNRISKKPDRIAALLQVAPEEETDLELDDEEVEGPLNTSPVDVQARLAEYAARVKEVSSVQ